MMNNGQWNGEQIIPADFVRASLEPVMNENSDGEKVDYYGYQWWLGEYEGSELFALRGLQGQYIIAIPERDLIIVRLGHKRSDQRRNHMPIDMYDVLNAGCYLDR
jgi:CubicO group peptidase (beta-lactamase class C family)